MRTVRLDTADLTDKRDVLTRMGERFGFPDYYGRNLDALVDCLRDIAEPVRLEWSGWETLQASDPTAFGRIMLVLDDRADVEPAFTVFLVDAD
jgi:RNAse (barnase) inhibitor barstar